MRRLPAWNRFLAVFPEALARDPAKPSSFAGNPQLWNDGSDRFYSDQKAPADVAFLNAMLDDLLARFAVDRARRWQHPDPRYEKHWRRDPDLSSGFSVARPIRPNALRPVPPETAARPALRA